MEDRQHTPRRESSKINPTIKELMAIKRPGYHAAGKGLYLSISKAGSRSWVFRYVYAGRQKEMGLGSLDKVSLAVARGKAEEVRHQLGEGKDPLGEKQKAEEARRLDAARRITFEEAARQYIDSHRPGWKNAKHATQWENTLRDYALPVFGKIAVQDVDTALVMKALEPIWTAKNETASRVRGRIESVLDWATTRGYRQGENPARWRGHLENLLPAPSKVQKVEHHAALPFKDIGAFVAELRGMQSTSARALEFLILTASRTSEVIGARWEEFDQDFQVWTVPAARMKAKKEHRVPLSVRAREIILSLRQSSRGDFVFEGDKEGKPLSNMALLMLLRRMGRSDLTAHGFRSTFRDWASERTNYPREVAEMALAHAIPSAVEAAYRRGDLFAKRRKLMLAWEAECNTHYLNGGTVSASVVFIKTA